MQDAARGCAAEGARASAEGSKVSAKGRSRRRWSAKEKARVVHESLRPGRRVGEVVRRYGISRRRLSERRSATHRGKLEIASSAPPAVVDSESPPTFAALKVDRAPGPGPTGSVVIEAHGVPAHTPSLKTSIALARPFTGCRPAGAGWNSGPSADAVAALTRMAVSLSTGNSALPSCSRR